MLIGELEWIIIMFLSAVWTLILTAPIHCNEKFLQICSDEVTNSSAGWSQGEDISSKFIFLGKLFLKLLKCEIELKIWVYIKYLIQCDMDMEMFCIKPKW